MRLLIGSMFFVHGLLVAPTQASDDGYFRLLNSYLALKLQFAEKAEDGKIVGAAWIRFENRTGERVSEIPLLLNPGLRVTKIVGPNNSTLGFTQKRTQIEDWPKLKLNAISAKLPKYLKDEGVLEISVNFEGWMQPLDDSGMGYVRETLSPDFTIFRLENFSYPVLAAPSEGAISAAGRLQNYYQAVSLEVPDGYRPAGNLQVASKALDGDRVKYELKSDTKVPSLMLPIARYGQVNRDQILVNFLDGDQQGAEGLADEAERALGLLTNWFGPAPDNRQLAITAIPEGFGSQRLPGLIIQDAAAFRNVKNFDELYHEIAHLWHPKEPALRPSRWNEGLAMMMQALVKAELQPDGDVTAFKEERFARVRSHFFRETAHGQIALADYGEKGVTDLSYSVGAVFFAVLHDLLGQQDFLKLIADMQSEFSLRGADTGSFSAFLMEKMPSTRSEDFVEGWFLSGTAGQDMAKASSFEELVALYR